MIEKPSSHGDNSPKKSHWKTRKGILPLECAVQRSDFLMPRYSNRGKGAGPTPPSAAVLASNDGDGRADTRRA